MFTPWNRCRGKQQRCLSLFAELDTRFSRTGGEVSPGRETALDNWKKILSLLHSAGGCREFYDLRGAARALGIADGPRVGSEEAAMSRCELSATRKLVERELSDAFVRTNATRCSFSFSSRPFK